MTRLQKTYHHLLQPESLAPVAVFRILFGGMMFIALLRFWLKGWIRDLYIDPGFYFSYQGFEWIKPLGDPGMYFLFGITAIAALFIALGLLYRASAIIFFLGFTYIELLDKTNYLNHYYFVSIVAFLLIFIPAHRNWSLDVRLKITGGTELIPRLYRRLLMVQLGIVYFFAGLAKLNSDWLIHAQPLKTWLKAHGHLPIVGGIMDSQWLPYLFSWSGAIYDLTIPFLLIWTRTRPLAYLAVISFHLVTGFLFPIGMFPYIMIGLTLIFFPPQFHENLLRKFRLKSFATGTVKRTPYPLALWGFAFFLIIQIIVPLRNIAYPGEVFWHEQGYRFSWRVMLMEKSGMAFFYVKDEGMRRAVEVRNSDFLTPNQEKMMATQPDMILQYAHFLEEHYRNLGMKNPEVSAKVFVTLNGRQSQLLIDPTVNLTSLKDSWRPKSWILPLNDEIRGL